MNSSTHAILTATCVAGFTTHPSEVCTAKVSTQGIRCGLFVNVLAEFQPPKCAADKTILLSVTGQQPSVGRSAEEVGDFSVLESTTKGADSTLDICDICQFVYNIIAPMELKTKEDLARVVDLAVQCADRVGKSTQLSRREM